MISPETDVYELRRLARDLADAYAELEELKWTPPRTPNVRVMKPQFRSTSPSPDSDWALNLQYELMRDTPDERVPGGLRAMAVDALGYTTASRAYLDETRPGMLCAYIARHAGDIAEKFPAADDLAELLTEQLAYLTRQIDTRQGTTRLTPVPADTMATGYGTAADLAPLVSATVGHHIDRKQITEWGRRSKITQYTTQDGTTHYQLAQVIQVAREYVGKRTRPAEEN